MKNGHIGPLIKMLNKEFEQRHAQKANAMGLTPVQLFVLHYISVNQGSSICHRNIEKQFELSHATVSGILSRLEAKGFIICSVDNSDRRVRNIIATEKAKCCESEIKQQIDHYEQQLVKGFSENEKELLFDFISRMLENVNAGLPLSGTKEEEK